MRENKVNASAAGREGGLGHKVNDAKAPARSI